LRAYFAYTSIPDNPDIFGNKHVKLSNPHILSLRNLSTPYGDILQFITLGQISAASLDIEGAMRSPAY
jgi:hypothetical protein